MLRARTNEQEAELIEKESAPVSVVASGSLDGSD